MRAVGIYGVRWLMGNLRNSCQADKSQSSPQDRFRHGSTYHYRLSETEASLKVYGRPALSLATTFAGFGDLKFVWKGLLWSFIFCTSLHRAPEL